MKRFASWCWLLAVLLLVLAACDNPFSHSSAPSAVAPKQVVVTLGDFFIRPSQTTFIANTPYHFVLHNRGIHNHDFLIMAPGSTDLQSMDLVYQQAISFVYNIAPQATETLDVTFHHIAPSGTLEMSCHYSGQYEAGMHAGIVIKAPAGQTLTPYPKSSLATTQQPQGQGGNPAACDAQVVVTMTNKLFSPASVSLKGGDTLTFRNTSQQEYTLTSKPSAGIRYTVASANETEYVPFMHAGTFLISTQEVPTMTLKVQVSSSQGVTCGFGAGPTVNIEASYPSPGVSNYFLAPQTLTIHEGQSLTLSNLSDQSVTFTSAPDASIAAGVELDPNEHQVILFPNSGTYTITCVQFLTQRLQVKVLENDS
jgi:plastocyanin/uncharacterized cupredoxin-like copper-binding protein